MAKVTKADEYTDAQKIDDLEHMCSDRDVRISELEDLVASYIKDLGDAEDGRDEARKAARTLLQRLEFTGATGVPESYTVKSWGPEAV